MVLRDKNAVKIGAVHIINDTLDANVILKAVFSKAKYNDPPHNPTPIKRSSSFIVFAKNFFGQKNHIAT
jgi:ActR/RegA family two-component response regulator